MKSLCLRLLLVLTILCASTGFAQTLINQSSISSFPYTISTPGSYKLSSNITVTTANVNAFNITSGDVTLDLGGYTISGPLVCTGASCNASSSSYGVYSSQPGSVIQNGFIKGFDICAQMIYGIVQNLNVYSCNYGIFASAATVRSNTAWGCYSVGIWGNQSLITENTANSNGSGGIYAIYSPAINNNSTYNNGYGLLIEYGPYSGNTLYGNGTDIATSGSATSSKNNSCTNAAC